MSRSALTKAREAPASTKARILTAAEAVFAAKGFEGASTREIAAAAGVNISSLHYHWESKETLYFAVFEDIYDRIVELVQSSIPEASLERPASRQVVDEAMGRLFDFFADHPNIPKLMVRRLLARKREGSHPDYTRGAFEEVLRTRFEIVSSVELPSGTRALYHAVPV